MTPPMSDSNVGGGEGTLASGDATGPSQAEPVVSALRASVPDARHGTANGAYTEALRDLAAASVYETAAIPGVLRDCADLIDKVERENSNLRIGFWNFMRGAAVHQDMAIQIIRDTAQGIAARSDETRSGSAVRQEPGPQGCAQPTSGDHP